MCSMVERTDTAWLTVLEKKGMHQVSGILENYGIHSETDERCSSRVSRWRGKGGNGWTGWETGTCMKLPFGCMRESEAYTDMHLEID
jgi:hypothetical protein